MKTKLKFLLATGTSKMVVLSHPGSMEIYARQNNGDGLSAEKILRTNAG